MLKYLFFAISPLFLFSETAFSSEKIREIASRSSIPLIQVAYSEGKRVSLYEVATADGVMEREDCSTVFQAASLSKPLFAYIVVKMAERGEIDLDAPLVRYADADRFDNWGYASLLTARIVLSHRSGLPNWALSPGSADWPASKISFRFRPDSAFSYSGEAYAYLQRAVENIRGRGLEEIAREEVFIPLGMSSTSYIWLDRYDSLASSGYTREGVNRGVGSFPRANSAYTLRTTAGDYIKFLSAITEGVGIGKRASKELFTPVIKAVRYPERPRECDNTIFWGLGVGIEKNRELGDIVFHWGDNGNFKALFIIVPKGRGKPKRILVYFTNSAAGHDVINDMAILFLGNKESLAIHDWVLK